MKWKSFFLKSENICFFDSPQCLADPQVIRVQMWGGPRVVCQWPYKSMWAEVPIPTTLFFSPVAASHVTIHPIGTIAGAVATGAFCAGGHIFFF